jgi:hypothetical protein
MKKPLRDRPGAPLAKPSMSDINFVPVRIAYSLCADQGNIIRPVADDILARRYNVGSTLPTL